MPVSDDLHEMPMIAINRTGLPALSDEELRTNDAAPAHHRQNTRGHVCCATSYLAAQQHTPAHFPVQWLLAALTKTGHLAAATVNLHQLA